MNSLYVWDCERPLTASSCWKPFHKPTGDPKSCRITEQLNNSVTGWRLHMKARTGSSSSTEGTSGWTTRFRYYSRRAVTRVQSPAPVRPGWTPQTVRVAAGSGRKPSAVATWHEEQRQIWLVPACVWQTDRQSSPFGGHFRWWKWHVEIIISNVTHCTAACELVGLCSAEKSGAVMSAALIVA